MICIVCGGFAATHNANHQSGASSVVIIESRHFEGIEDNLELMKVHYPPGWLMRVYYDLDDNDPVLAKLCRLACASPTLDICNVRQLPGNPLADATKVFAMVWRFFPTLDPQVDAYGSRDLDSRISAREEAAVKDFMASDQPLHSMRDHPQHGAVFLGGMWGAHLNRKGSRSTWKTAWSEMLGMGKAWAPRNSTGGPDQGLLKNPDGGP
jgi:hypothetical protein